MSKSKFMVRAKGLNKIYRLYTKPHYRFMDMFGLLHNPAAYHEHHALKNIDLEIHRGEKIAFIGRNGAGKSTLLKLITGVIKPSSGTLEVSQGAHALLQIGAGFHPDFTGRQNALAYLAYLGVSGVQAEKQIASIIDFSELEEYIDQPIKTYSTGMVARLMFATSTAIEPELLVLDEILGVGDAYFAQKSFDRITEMCQQSGTTVLLVSHDIYSAAKLCDRIIWIDGGVIISDDIPRVTLKAYEQSIRMQEENRLRKKTVLQENHTDHEHETLIIEISTQENKVFEAAIYFKEIILSLNGCVINRFDFENETSDHSKLMTEDMCWGDTTSWQGEVCRPMLTYRSPYHKVAMIFKLRKDQMTSALDVSIQYGSDAKGELQITFYNGTKMMFSSPLPIIDTGRWIQNTIPFENRAASPLTLSHSDSNGTFGTWALVVQSVLIFDSSGKETYILEHGRPGEFQIAYHVNDQSLNEHVEITLNFLNEGVSSACRVFTKSLRIDATMKSSGVLKLFLPKIPLGVGTYFMSIRLSREGYNEKTGHKFFSINPDLYFLSRDIVKFQVRGGGLVADGTSCVFDGQWSFLEDKFLHESDTPLLSEEIK